MYKITNLRLGRVKKIRSKEGSFTLFSIIQNSDDVADYYYVLLKILILLFVLFVAIWKFTFEIIIKKKKTAYRKKLEWEFTAYP